MLEKVIRVEKKYEGNNGVICLRDLDDGAKRSYRKECERDEEQISVSVNDLEDLITKRPRKDLGACIDGRFCVDSSATIINLQEAKGDQHVGACFTDGFDPRKYCIVGELTDHAFLAKESEMGLLSAINRLENLERIYIQKTLDGFEKIKKSASGSKKVRAWVRVDPISFAEIEGETMIVDDYNLQNVSMMSIRKSPFDPLGAMTFVGFPRLSCETTTENGRTVLACSNSRK